MVALYEYTDADGDLFSTELDEEAARSLMRKFDNTPMTPMILCHRSDPETVIAITANVHIP